MANTATVTAPVGAGVTVTAVVLSNVVDIDFNIGGSTFSVVWNNGLNRQTFDYSTIATITMTHSGGATSLTITT